MSTTLSDDEMAGLKVPNIETLAQLNALEARNIIKARIYRCNPLDVGSLSTLHKKMFGDVWQWAGRYRTSEKNIGVAPNEVAARLAQHLDQICGFIEFQSYPHVEILARYHHGLVFVHPFANGNGRWARLATDSLATRIKHTRVEWRADDADREAYIDALRQADSKNFQVLTNLFEKWIENQ